MANMTKSERQERIRRQMKTYHGTEAEKMQAIIDYIKKYKVDIKAEKVFALNEVPKAHAYLESADSFGKVVVLNDQ